MVPERWRHVNCMLVKDCLPVWLQDKESVPSIDRYEGLAALIDKSGRERPQARTPRRSQPGQAEVLPRPPPRFRHHRRRESLGRTPRSILLAGCATSSMRIVVPSSMRGRSYTWCAMLSTRAQDKNRYSQSASNLCPGVCPTLNHHRNLTQRRTNCSEGSTMA